VVYSQPMQPISLYLHIPFCTHRCAYCDFNTYSGLEHLIPDYIEAMCREIEFISNSVAEKLSVKTIFFGGGTPSLLPVSQLEKIILALDAHFQILPQSEITLEANPGTVSLGYLRSLVSLGLNRLSLGMQSANPRELRLLERQHGLQDVFQAVKWARKAGIHNLNLDLIFGLPGQKPEEWESNLLQAVAMDPDHLSLYALTLEHGTPMDHWVQRGLLAEPDPDIAADMYEYSMDYLRRAGYLHYEISNWAREGDNGTAQCCLHNLQYWRDLPYLGIGAGAHGYANGLRVANTLAPAQYIRRYSGDIAIPSCEFPKTPSTVTMERIEQKEEMAEMMIMGLRLIQEGVSKDSFAQRFGQALESAYRDEIEELIHLGLLEWAAVPENSLRLTPKGRLLGNQVFIRFI
jgi:putative oxygen-independent coproporphyrinogen III oxidase